MTFIIALLIGIPLAVYSSLFLLANCPTILLFLGCLLLGNLIGRVVWYIVHTIEDIFHDNLQH